MAGWFMPCMKAFRSATGSVIIALLEGPQSPMPSWRVGCGAAMLRYPRGRPAKVPGAACGRAPVLACARRVEAAISGAYSC